MFVFRVLSKKKATEQRVMHEWISGFVMSRYGSLGVSAVLFRVPVPSCLMCSVRQVCCRYVRKEKPTRIFSI
jgi:hypothetical protein